MQMADGALCFSIRNRHARIITRRIWKQICSRILEAKAIQRLAEYFAAL